MDTFYDTNEQNDLVRKNHRQYIHNVTGIIGDSIRKHSSDPTDDYSQELEQAALWLFPSISEDGMLAWKIYEDNNDRSLTFSQVGKGWSFWISLYKEHGFIKIYGFVKNPHELKPSVDESIDFIDFDKLPTEYLVIQHIVELYRQFSEEKRKS